MKRSASVLTMIGLLAILIQSGCVKKVAPVTGSSGLEGGDESGFDRPSDAFSGGSDGLREEAIRDEEVFRPETEEIKTERPAPISLVDIYFDYDRASLTDRAEKTLRDNGKNLMQSPRTKILISGHTDERGSNEYNLALGARRARTVKQFLEAFGIEPSRMEMISYGEEKPFCRENRENCHPLNRRAHFVVKPER